MNIPTSAAAIFLSLFIQTGHAQEFIKYYSPNPGVQKPFTVYQDDSQVPEYVLPDLLLTDAGKAVDSEEIWWKQRRPELLSLFENEMFGKTPSFAFAVDGFLRHPIAEVRSEKPDAIGGKATRREVRLHFTQQKNGFFIDVLMYLPNKAKKACPAFTGLNFRGNQAITDEPDIHICESWITGRNDETELRNKSTEKSRGAAKSRWPVERIINRGYALVTACYQDIDPDFDDDFKNGIHPYFYKKGQTKPAANEWGSIGAWAWGLSRILDYIETEKRINPQQVAVIGHSRLGKTSLWAGAQDQRFALVVSNNSGCGGTALSKRRFGERVDIITYVRPHWFCRNFDYYSDNEQALPFDQHALVALIAPRPVYVASSVEDKWADPKGEYLSALNADPVYRLLGTQGAGTATKNVTVKKGALVYDVRMPSLNQPVGDIIHYHIREGKHDITSYDWEQYLNFADKYLLQK